MSAVSAVQCLARVPEPVRTAVRSLQGVHAYAVGGFIRDVLLKRGTHDLDLAIEGDGATAARSLAGRLGGALVVLDRERGTYRIALRRALDGIEEIDITRLRAPTIQDDLRGRDFTINAIALDLASGPVEFIDPTAGLSDLEEGLIRAASPNTFADDPVRLLRAVRFALQLDFRLDEATATLARGHAQKLGLPAAERRRDEFAQILRSDRAAAGVAMLGDLGLLFTLVPDLAESVGIEQPKEHYYDVYQHSVQTLAAVDAMLAGGPPLNERPSMLRDTLWQHAAWFAPVRERLDKVAGEGRPRLVALKLAALLHDVSKPETKSVDPATGRMRFFGHDDLGARRVSAIARNLRFSTREVEYIALLVREHLRPGMLAAPGEVPTRRALYRFARDLGDAAPDVLLLNLADHAAARGPRLEREEFVRHVRFVAWVLHMLYGDTEVAHPPKLVGGDDLMRELGLQPGPAIGRLLGAIQEAQAAGEVTTVEQALTLARTIVEQMATGK